ncbi:hypothetical protein DM860_015681 [Cuscuta australis]|uniref:Uncharacterized protein n=1 Tax=Cuscuta australis TaxID=267555 RepID=A0A328DJJ3_9ASTE|nr:hypothetical protein DM860_015681 [Cuscuta australis]
MRIGSDMKTRPLGMEHIITRDMISITKVLFAFLILHWELIQGQVEQSLDKQRVARIVKFNKQVARVGHHISDSLGAKDSKDDEAIYKPYFTSFVGGVAKDHALGNNHQSLISILPCAIIMSHLPDIIKECLVSTDATIHEIVFISYFSYNMSRGRSIANWLSDGFIFWVNFMTPVQKHEWKPLPSVAMLTEIQN